MVEDFAITMDIDWQTSIAGYGLLKINDSGYVCEYREITEREYKAYENELTKLNEWKKI